MDILRRLKIAVMRCVIQTVGKTSDGIRISFESGLTSGIMLDYIYRNQPSGRFLIGRLVDRIYLSHRGWEVVRIRKSNLQSLIHEAFAIQRRLGRSPVLLDVASGPAQYVLDVLSEDQMHDVQAICRDLDQGPLELGRRNAMERGIKPVRFELGDALSATSLAEVEPRCNIAVSSGFYDWIADDSMVQKSMELLFDLLPDGGCFVFTNQSGHVDLEMVNSIFVSPGSQPLQMVVRPAEVVNSWAKAKGFKTLQTASDRFGHYSVTLAQKPPAMEGG
jgi:SAM-dependent methyltransferase